MSKLELIYTIALAVVVLVLVVYYLIMAIKNGWINKITATLNEAIKYAEDNITGSSKKKEYVMSKVEEKCVELGIPYYLIKNLVSKLINRIIKDHNVIAHNE